MCDCPYEESMRRIPVTGSPSRDPRHGVPVTGSPSRGIIASIEYRKIESHRMYLSGSWHSGRSHHEQYLGGPGSSVQDSSRSKQFKLNSTLPRSPGGWFQ